MTAFLVLLSAFVAYILPSVIARLRNHKNTNSLFIINLFFGWTILGWVICLAWSFSSNVAEKKVDTAAPNKGPHPNWNVETKPDANK
ncbi:MAG: hypothetical protein RIS36_1556 [Pseudomonadota bacterium]|jgi:Na+/proline symporter